MNRLPFYKLRISLFVLFFWSSIKVFPQSKTQNFNPDNWQHQHLGCPHNSECNQKSGEFFYLWKKLNQAKLRNKELKGFVKKHGLPIQAWWQGPLPQKTKAAFWTSRCEHHRKAKPAYLWTEIFLKQSFSPEVMQANMHLNKNEKLLLNPLFISSTKQNTQIIWSPRDETPHSMRKGKAHFLIPAQKNFIGLAIDTRGRWNVETPSSEQSNRVGTTVCPKHLIQSYLEFNKQHKLFQGYSCYLYLDKSRRYVLLKAKEC